LASLPAGAYTLRAQMNGYAEAIVSRIPLARKEMKKMISCSRRVRHLNRKHITDRTANCQAERSGARIFRRTAIHCRGRDRGRDGGRTRI